MADYVDRIDGEREFSACAKRGSTCTWTLPKRIAMHRRLPLDLDDVGTMLHVAEIDSSAQDAKNQ